MSAASVVFRFFDFFSVLFSPPVSFFSLVILNEKTRQLRYTLVVSFYRQYMFGPPQSLKTISPSPDRVRGGW